MNATLADRLAADFAAAAPALPAGILGVARRQRALGALLERGLPSPRDDAWKYANLRSLEHARFAPAPPLTRVPETLPPAIEGFARYVFVDGRLHADASALLGKDAGVAVERRQATAREPEPDAAVARLALANEAFAVDALHVAADATATPRGIEIVAVAAGEAATGASYPRIEIVLERGARLQLIERHISLGETASLVNVAVAVKLAESAMLEHVRIQDCAPRATWLDSLHAHLAQRAQYQLASIALGSQSARSTLEIDLAGREAQLTLDGLSVADGTQVHDTYALVRHGAARSRTTEVFRGIAAGRSRVAFNGHIVVDTGAAGVDSQQSLRGLLAGPAAEIDLRPQLEIYTDDVRCSHGATAGKLDDTMLFYLLSRGLEPDVARTLLEWAFLEDVVARIPVPPLRAQLERRLAGRLRDAPAAGELLG